MPSVPSLLTLAHLIGLALAVGSATSKLTLLLKCRADTAFLPTYIAAAKTITRLIVVGLALLTLSGVGWLLLGYPFSGLLIVKLALVCLIWVLGPIIDNVVEPRFQRLAPRTGDSPSFEFIRIQGRYVLLELFATGLFYVIIVIWMLL